MGRHLLDAPVFSHQHSLRLHHQCAAWRRQWLHHAPLMLLLQHPNLPRYVQLLSHIHFGRSRGSSAEVQSLSFAIDSSDRLASKTSVTATLDFTPTTPIPSGGTITLSYPSGFFASSVLPNVAIGASSITNLRAWSGLTTASSFVITITLHFPPGFFSSFSTPASELGASSVQGLSLAFSAMTSSSVVISTSGAAIVQALPFTVTIGGMALGNQTAGADIIVQTSSETCSSLPVSSGPIVATPNPCPIYDSRGADDAPNCPVGTLACLSDQPCNQRYCYSPDQDCMVSTYMLTEYDYCPAKQIGAVGGRSPFDIAGVPLWFRQPGKDEIRCSNFKQ